MGYAFDGYCETAVGYPRRTLHGRLLISRFFLNSEVLRDARLTVPLRVVPVKFVAFTIRHRRHFTDAALGIVAVRGKTEVAVMARWLSVARAIGISPFVAIIIAIEIIAEVQTLDTAPGDIQVERLANDKKGFICC